jgi:hypothetical protein
VRLVVLLLGERELELRLHALELLGLRKGALDSLALRLHGGGLLRDGIAQRLERAHRALDLGDGGADAVHLAHDVLDVDDAALLVGEVARELLAAAVERLDLRGRELVRVHQAVVLLAQAVERLGGLVDRAADALALAAQQLERLLDLEERLEPGAQALGHVGLLGQFLEHLADAARVLDRGRDLLGGLVLARSQLLRARLDGVEAGGDRRQRREFFLDAGEATGHALDLGRGARDRLVQARQGEGRLGAARKQLVEALALAADLLDGSADLVGQLAIASVVAEEVLQDGHRSRSLFGHNGQGDHGRRHARSHGREIALQNASPPGVARRSDEFGVSWERRDRAGQVRSRSNNGRSVRNHSRCPTHRAPAVHALIRSAFGNRCRAAFKLIHLFSQ